MAVAFFYAKKHGYKSSVRLTFKEAMIVVWQAVPSLFLIIIVIGGIIAGVFTATEGSAIAVAYSLILSLFIYRTIDLKELVHILIDSAKMTGIIIFLVGASNIMAWVMTFTGIPEAISSAITHYLTPLLKGQSADNLNALTARMNGAIKGNTFAKSAIETALLDAQGKALGLPVSALLGGALQTALPVLWTLASGDTAKDIAEGEKLLAEGRHRAFKLKIGARELATDLRHTRAIVEALGDRASIRVDVNQAWDAATGAKGCRELAAMGVDLIEQPVSAHDNAALVRLSQQIETAILADEAVATAYDGYQLAQQGFTGAYALKIAKAAKSIE